MNDCKKMKTLFKYLCFGSICVFFTLVIFDNYGTFYFHVFSVLKEISIHIRINRLAHLVHICFQMDIKSCGHPSLRMSIWKHTQLIYVILLLKQGHLKIIMSNVAVLTSPLRWESSRWFIFLLCYPSLSYSAVHAGWTRAGGNNTIKNISVRITKYWKWVDSVLNCNGWLSNHHHHPCYCVVVVIIILIIIIVITFIIITTRIILKSYIFICCLLLTIYVVNKKVNCSMYL